MGKVSMYSFIIEGLINPAIVVSRGSKVTMIAVNVDSDAYHTFTLTRLQPPYPYMAGHLMMGSLPSTGTLPPSSGGRYAAKTISFIAEYPAYYVCAYPGHAQNGMYGQFMVG